MIKRPAIWGFVACVAAGLAAGGWTRRINPDGLSYFDLADRWIDAPLTAVNAYWSPLYSLLLSLSMRLTGSDTAAELLAGRAMNALLFVVAVWLLFALARELGIEALEETEQVAVCAAVALYSLITLAGIWLVTPDLLVCCIVLGSALLAVRFLREGTARGALLLGCVLGCGYLAKAPMLPLGVLFLAILFVRFPERRRALVTAVVAIVLIAGTWATVLSICKGRVTFGDSARLNWAWYAAGVPRRVAVDGPVLFLDGARTNGTYPPWLEPSRWYPLPAVHFDSAAQLEALAGNLRELAKVVAPLLPALAGVFFLRRRIRFSRLPEAVALLMWCAGACAIYLPVHLEPRFIAGFLAVAAIAALSMVKAGNPPRVRVAVAWLVTVPLLAVFASGAVSTALWTPRSSVDRNIANAFVMAGGRNGDGVALIGETFDLYWARLAGARITAQIGADRFWSRPPAAREAVLKEFAGVADTRWALSPIAPPERLHWTALYSWSHFLRPL